MSTPELPECRLKSLVVALFETFWLLSDIEDSCRCLVLYFPMFESDSESLKKGNFDRIFSCGDEKVCKLGVFRVFQ